MKKNTVSVIILFVFIAVIAWGYILSGNEAIVSTTRVGIILNLMATMVMAVIIRVAAQSFTFDSVSGNISIIRQG